MKKAILFILALAILLCAGFAACGGSTDTKGANSENGAVSDNGNLGDFQVKIKDKFQIAKDFEGNDCIVITCKFTNNSEDAQMFSVAMIDKAYQDGIEIEKAYVMKNEKKFPLDDADKSIKPGTSINVKLAYKLTSSTSPVEVEVEELISLSSAKITKTFAIGK